MLPKENRLRRKEATGTLQKSSYIHSPHLLFRYTKAKGSPTFSFVVSKKVARGAVDRNTIKRRGYAALEAFLEDVFDVRGIFFAKKGVENLSKQELGQEIEEVLKKARLL